MICHFAAYEFHQAKRGPVLRTASSTVWNFSPPTMTDGLAAASLREQSLDHSIYVRVKNTGGKE